MASRFFILVVVVTFLWSQVRCDMTDLYRNLHAGNCSIEVVSPLGDTLTLVVDKQAYTLPFTAEAINSTSVNLFKANHHGTWTTVPWLGAAAEAFKSLVVSDRMTLKQADQLVAKSGQVYVSLVVEEGHVVLHLGDDGKTKPKLVGETKQFGVVTDGKADGHGYALWNDSFHRGVVQEVGNQPQETRFCLPITNYRQDDSHPLAVRLSANSTQITFFRRNSNPPESGKLRLPVYGFIFNGTIHLWLPKEQKALVFEDLGAEGLKDLETGKMFSKTVKVKVIPFDQYFLNVDLNNTYRHWIILGSITIGILFISILLIFFAIRRRRRRRANAKKSKPATTKANKAPLPVPLSLSLKTAGSGLSEILSSKVSTTTSHTGTSGTSDNKSKDTSSNQQQPKTVVKSKPPPVAKPAAKLKIAKTGKTQKRHFPVLRYPKSAILALKEAEAKAKAQKALEDSKSWADLGILITSPPGPANGNEVLKKNNTSP